MIKVCVRHLPKNGELGEGGEIKQTHHGKLQIWSEPWPKTFPVYSHLTTFPRGFPESLNLPWPSRKGNNIYPALVCVCFWHWSKLPSGACKNIDTGYLLGSLDIVSYKRLGQANVTRFINSIQHMNIDAVFISSKEGTLRWLHRLRHLWPSLMTKGQSLESTWWKKKSWPLWVVVWPPCVCYDTLVCTCTHKKIVKWMYKTENSKG